MIVLVFHLVLGSKHLSCDCAATFKHRPDGGSSFSSRLRSQARCEKCLPSSFVPHACLSLP
eukprot:756826-Hanusia_phi.AAC.3